jgi:hypothetical protein
VGVLVRESQERRGGDASAANLFSRIGLPEFAYYSAGEERAAETALHSWPLLGAIAGALRGQPASNDRPPVRILEVVSTVEPVEEAPVGWREPR